ncbi:Chorismate mutase I / Prephenate dehydratase [Planctomycetales bacterium 10988]|nr:Chorismate mutase I / Prephenate dehydratase [Planctomycetales bacterium 10988]
MAENPSQATNIEVSSDSSLAELRCQIDELDRKLVQLVNDRAKLAVQIGKIKGERGQTIYAPEREDQVIQQALENSTGPLPKDCLQAIFRELMSGSRALQKKLRVGFLGPTFSYSYLAALERFGQCVDWVGVSNIAAVFEAVNRGDVDYGIVPLENSTDGRIVDTLDMFTRIPVKICGEVFLRIHHCLLARGRWEDIHEVTSKPQALSQCRDWLSRNLPNAKVTPAGSTAGAAERACKEPGVAAIASKEAGTRWGLDIHGENIEDNPSNITRFAVIGEDAHELTGNDKTAVMFQVAHQPGSLADALNLFKSSDLNLTWIESFPIPEGEGYLFFIEFWGHESEPKVAKALEQLMGLSLRFEVLGSFPRSQPSEC